MHRSRTSLLIWFWAIYLVSTDKRGLSALALSKKLGISYWKAWIMLQKIRKAIGDRDSNYQLAGIIEIIKTDGFRAYNIISKTGHSHL